jgi:hypothetical protein
MAMTINVSGPVTLQFSADGSSWADLGMSDNDDLPTIAFTEHLHEVKTVQGGNAPVEIVLQNTTATISVTLVNWDASQFANMIAAQRGGSATTPDVGYTMVANGGVFAVRLRPIGGGTGYSFGTVFLRSDSVSDTKWGNVERRLSLNFQAIPTPGTNVLYSYGNIA